MDSTDIAKHAVEGVKHVDAQKLILKYGAEKVLTLMAAGVHDLRKMSKFLDHDIDGDLIESIVE